MKFNFSVRFLTAVTIAFAAAAIAPSNAFAATGATVNISGTVVSTLAIVAVPTVNATTLNLTAGAKTVKIADLAITTNNIAGYTLTATEGNMTLVGQAALSPITFAPLTPIPFKVTTTADGAAAPTAAAFTGAAGSYTYGDNAAAGVDLRDLYVAYNPTTAQATGLYTGAITLTVADK